MQVEIALHLVAKLLDLDALGGGLVGVADRIAEGERLQDELDRVRLALVPRRTGGSSPISWNACGRCVVVAPACSNSPISPLLRPPLSQELRARYVDFATFGSACTA
jgi:hypothetical protein